MPQPKFLLYLTILFLLLVYFDIVPIARADDQYFGISLDCLDSCKDKSVDSSNDIMLVLKITNNLDYWVSIGDADNINPQSVFRMNVENANLQTDNYLQPAGNKVETHQDLLAKGVFIKPKADVEIYIPFDTYNKLGKDNRLGDWKISPELQINNNPYSYSYSNINFYNTTFESKPIPLTYSNGQSFTIKSPIKGNVLEFKVVKPEIQVQGENSSAIPNGSRFVDSLFNFINSNIIATILGGTVSGLIVSYIAYKYFTRRRKKK